MCGGSPLIVVRVFLVVWVWSFVVGENSQERRRKLILSFSPL